MQTTTYKTNITLAELESLVKFSKEHGESQFKTITVAFLGTELGSTVFAANNYDSPVLLDVTEYEAW